MGILVTQGGECFSAEYEDAGRAENRDGVLFYFKITDLAMARGTRYVSLFLSHPERIFIENYDERLELVRLNTIRRAFDSKTLDFRSSVPPGGYKEIPLRARDFQSQPSASDEQIRHFLKLGGYWIGFKARPNEPNPYVDFDCTEDLDYLGTTTEAVARNLWLLTDKGYFRASGVSFPRTLRATPTHTLIDEVESPGGNIVTQQGGTNLTQNFHMHGHNPRVNVNSVDNSSNIVSASNGPLFIQLRDKVSSITDVRERANIVARLDELERAQGSSGLVQAYQNFIASVANHITVFAPFIPALTQMLSGN